MKRLILTSLLLLAAYGYSPGADIYVTTSSDANWSALSITAGDTVYLAESGVTLRQDANHTTASAVIMRTLPFDDANGAATDANIKLYNQLQTVEANCFLEANIFPGPSHAFYINTSGTRIVDLIDLNGTTSSTRSFEVNSSGGFTRITCRHLNNGSSGYGIRMASSSGGAVVVTGDAYLRTNQYLVYFATKGGIIVEGNCVGGVGGISVIGTQATLEVHLNRAWTSVVNSGCVDFGGTDSNLYVREIGEETLNAFPFGICPKARLHLDPNARMYASNMLPGAIPANDPNFRLTYRCVPLVATDDGNIVAQGTFAWATMAVADPNWVDAEAGGALARLSPDKVVAGQLYGPLDANKGTLTTGRKPSEWNVYANLQDGNDSLTWACAQDPNYPMLTLNRALVLAVAETLPGDTIYVNVKSSEVRTAQCVNPDWSASPVRGRTFKFQPWDCGGNTGGRWYCKGPDATKYALFQPSLIIDSNLTLAVTFRLMDCAEGAATTRIIDRDAGSDEHVVITLDNCVVEANVPLVYGAGTAGLFDVNLLDSTINVAGWVVPAISGVTAMTIRGTALLSATGGTTGLLAFSASSKLGYLNISDSDISAAALGVNTGIDLTNNDANFVHITGSTIAAASATAAPLIYMPDTGAASVDLMVARNRLYWAGTGSTHAVLMFGKYVDSNTRAFTASTMNKAWYGGAGTPLIMDNTLVQSKIDGHVLDVMIGADGFVIQRNLIEGPLDGNGHTFYVAGNNCGIYGNVSHGSLPLLLFGDSPDANGNDVFCTAPSAAGILIGAPGGTAWEPTAGGIIIGNRVVMLVNSPCFSDYSNGALGVWNVSTVVDKNTYIPTDGNQAIFLRNTNCATILDANTQWNLMTDPGVHQNDAGSTIRPSKSGSGTGGVRPPPFLQMGMEGPLALLFGAAAIGTFIRWAKDRRKVR